MIQNELPRSLNDNPRPADWISFTQDGRVRLATGKVELGQGILTALLQLAAEELCILPARFDVVSGETGRSPEEIFTSGSQSIENSGGAIRIICAEIRRRLLDLAADGQKQPHAAFDLIDGRAFRDGKATGYDYWTVADRLDLSRTITESPLFLPKSRHRVVGRSMPRVDLPSKVFGGGFIHDVELPGMRHARVLRGPVREARLVAFDEEQVRRIASVDVFRRGRFVALVGETEHAVNAGLAAALRDARWDLPDLEACAADPRSLTRRASVDRIVRDEGTSRETGERLFAAYSRPFLAHGSIAPSCALAAWDGSILSVFTHSQGVGPLRQAIARALGIDLDRISVTHRHSAGCYGQNGADDAALDAAITAMGYRGAPVRVQWTRENEMSVAPFGPAMVVHIAATVGASGRPHNWQADIWSCSHGRRPGMGGKVNLIAAGEIGCEGEGWEDGEPFDVPDQAGGGGTRNAVAPYDLPEQSIRYHLVRRQPLHTSSMRALGAQANVFAIESFMDELADHVGSDPLAYRLGVLSDPRLRGVLQAVADMCNWSRRGEPGTGCGLGLAVSRYKNHAGYAAVAAELDVEQEPRLRRLWCAADAGLVVNPDGVINQIEGGMIQAASWSLKEQVRFDESGIISSSWEEYPILRFSEIPDIEVRLLDVDSETPLGVGEIVVGPTTAAIGNALAHALGFRLRDLPFTRERLMESILAQS
jgi:CO/xanthine dehydrogenase Mo-binding subunit